MQFIPVLGKNPHNRRYRTLKLKADSTRQKSTDIDHNTHLTMSDSDLFADKDKAGGSPSAPITPELVERGEKALAHIIGPLAKVLVGRYAKSAHNSRQFFELLAGHIRNPEERQAFFQIVRDETE